MLMNAFIEPFEGLQKCRNRFILLKYFYLYYLISNRNETIDFIARLWLHKFIKIVIFSLEFILLDAKDWCK